MDKTEEMIGSYGPATEAYEKKFMPEEAPSGMLARGHYEVKSKFVDDDGTVHMDWGWVLYCSNSRRSISRRIGDLINTLYIAIV